MLEIEFIIKYTIVKKISDNQWTTHGFRWPIGVSVGFEHENTQIRFTANFKVYNNSNFTTK